MSSGDEALFGSAGLSAVDNGDFRIPNLSAEYLYLDVGLSPAAPHASAWLQAPGSNRLVVFGFEASPTCVEMIRTGSSPFDTRLDPALIGRNFFLFPCALGSSNGISTLFETEDLGQSSFLKPATSDPEFAIKSQRTVQCVTLDYVLEKVVNTPKVIGRLKIDTQGFDLEVLKGSSRSLSRVVFVTIEIDTTRYQGSTNSRLGVVLYLGRKGFLYLPRSLKGALRLLARTHVVTADPTFLNLRFLMRLRRLGLTIFQVY